MSGTIVINKGLTGCSQKNWVKASVDGVKGEKLRDAFSADVRAEAGTRKLAVSFGGFRTNTITLDVEEGVRHQVNVVPTRLEVLLRTPLFGLLGVLVLAAIPGSVFRIEAS